MKTVKTILTASSLALLAFAAAAGDAKLAVGQAAWIGSRAAVTAATRVTLVTAPTTALGVLIAPSKIGCGPNELCTQTTRK